VDSGVLALPSAERHVLAAVAIVGRASLSEAELAELVEIDDVRPLLRDLERRGLIERHDRNRYSLLADIGDEIRKTDDALATGDQLMQYLKTLAGAGSLTPARLADDAQAILGLSEWAAEHGQWASLLELVKTLQSCFAIAQRVQQLLTLLERGRSAAGALGDRQAEVWVLQQLATASTQAGDTTAARQYLHEADELQRGLPPGASNGGGVPRPVLQILALAAVAVAGIGVGYLVGAHRGNAGSITTTVPVEVTAHGQTVTTSIARTLPPVTVTSTTTDVTTVFTATTSVTTFLK
jgi:DNA-binding MarR family transcriptional regulator